MQVPELSLTTPALLFPAISLLFLAYNGRFLAIAGVVRQLHTKWENGSTDTHIAIQIDSLVSRVRKIRNMQACGVASFFFCVQSMILIYLSLHLAAALAFGLSLLLLAASLWISLLEILDSTRALNLEIRDMKRADLPS